MAQQAIFGPFFATMILTLAMWVYMYVRRIHFITTSKLSPQDLAAPGELARTSPPTVSGAWPSPQAAHWPLTETSPLRSLNLS